METALIILLAILIFLLGFVIGCIRTESINRVKRHQMAWKQRIREIT